MEEGEFVYIDYTARIKDTGEIFDSTKGKSLPIIVGANLVIRGLDEILKEMEVGERKIVEIPPAKAFGERKIEFVKLIPLSKFKEKDVEPQPGQYVKVNGLNGKILSIDGGRVRVDFNHPLAGKALEYEVEIKERIEDKDEKVKAIVDFFTGIKEGVEVVTQDHEVEIKIKNVEMLRTTKKLIADTIIKWVGKIEKVKFVDIFEKSS